jgi:hypothetical protein
MAKLSFGVILALLLGGVALAGEDDAHGVPPVEDARFEFLKGLEGSWIAAAGPDEHAGSLFEFRVTAGGHAIEEREMIGTPMEMLTVYHMEGDDLMATHYCMLGNQPRAKAAREVIDDGLGFGCDGRPGNSATHADKHVHGWSMRLDEKGRLHYTAEILERDEVAEAPSFILTRRSAS